MDSFDRVGGRLFAQGAYSQIACSNDTIPDGRKTTTGPRDGKVNRTERVSAADSDPKTGPDSCTHFRLFIEAEKDPGIPVSIGSRQLLHEYGLIIKRGQLLEDWAFARLPPCGN